MEEMVLLLGVFNVCLEQEAVHLCKQDNRRTVYPVN